MSIALLAGGLLLVAIGTLDALWTLLWVEAHAAPLTKRITSTVNSAYVALFRRRGHRMLSAKGPLMLLTSILAWALFVWLGWTMVFSAQPNAVVHTHTGAAASFAERAYFVGYTIFTLGNGDFGARSAAFQLLTPVASMNGLVLVTLVVTYLLSIIEAVVKKRSFASHVAALGHRAEDMLRVAWDGQGFRALELQLLSLTEQINLITEQHKAYPMVHYFHAPADRQAMPIGVAIFDDALTLLDSAVAKDVRPARSIVQAARASVRSFLETLESVYIRPTDSPPPAPELVWLRDAGIPTVGDAEFASALRNVEERRRLLRAAVEAEHREWPGARIAQSASP